MMLMLMIDCWDDGDDDHHDHSWMMNDDADDPFKRDVQEEREKEEQLDRELLEMARRKARDGDFKIDNVLDKPALLIVGFASDLYLSNATNLQIAMLSTISDKFNAVTGGCKRKHCVSS